ncbi:ClbS/DfsB family four-helix bundle protein [Ruegeria sp. 2205SS24-7]|uniref:ClbS/DfsB family four-helix bundle protein n=1 Tax=Ruegeria discodermiae TaxID=3064389 RepID=UPI0027405029|nr:ClbS/DfsB family four-helix bundle protein [Ruegeria sp. 2205SS24-7]MDP5216676.1 ClbS/DfsB family four-helix bundle protein [Ruegeria sp. 2205SS24-7]
MPAATNKSDLLAAFDKELAKLRKTFDGINDAQSSLSLQDDNTTIKAVIAHRTHWMGMFHGWYEDGIAGREVHVPAKGYKWNQLKEYNDRLYAMGDATAWDDLLAEFETACKKLRAFIESHENIELYASGVHGWTGKWTLGRYAEASGPSHFRSANTYIRKVLRNSW